MQPQAVKLFLSLVATLLSLVVLEVALRGYRVVQKFSGDPSTSAPLHILVDAPYLYGLNPEHPEINPQGLRDDEVSVPKPRGVLRILVLGDSIAYGGGTSPDKTFANRLEARFRNQLGSVEVVNSGVSGYTAYNELHYYLTKGRELQPDIVVLAFCMNDVVNPRLHWDYTQEEIINIPREAIPNHTYDQNHVLPKLQEQKKTQYGSRRSLLGYSELYDTLESRLRWLLERTTGNEAARPPTHVTGEDSLSIEVLLDHNSHEWQWLTSIYDELHNAVKSDQATLVIAVFPLAYQLDENYPFLPQENIDRYCKQNSIHCIDLLQPFRLHRRENIFLSTHSGFYDDIWHLSEYGHDLSAAEISTFLKRHDLLRVTN